MRDEQIRQFILSDLMKGDQTTNLDANENLLNSGALDSLGIVKLIAFLEKNFNVSISDNEILPDNFETIDAISEFLDSKTS